MLNNLFLNHKFSKLFFNTLEKAAQGNPEPFVSLISKTIAKTSNIEDDPDELANWIVTTAWEVFELPNNEQFKLNMMKRVADELAT